MHSTNSSSGQLTIYAPDISLSGVQNHERRIQFDLLKPGEIFGSKYKILSYLSNGSMGIIYKAKHISLDSEFAIKTICTEELDETHILRFKNEAQAISRLNHPNIVAMHHFDFHKEKIPYYVMEFLDGEDLGTKIRKNGALSPAVVLPLFIDVCAGLSYAHRRGMLHRDVKPANFFILRAPDKAGSCLKIIDFGIVKFLEDLLPESQGLTAIGAVCGSPGYMSPECSGGKTLDERSDIYSLGCSLFEALTGELPYKGRTARETMMMHHEAPIPTLASAAAGRTYSKELEQVVSKMLAKTPEGRYQTMSDVAQDLKNVLDKSPLGTPQLIDLNIGTASGSFDSISLPPLLTQVSEYRLSLQETDIDDATQPSLSTIAVSLNQPANKKFLLPASALILLVLAAIAFYLSTGLK